MAKTKKNTESNAPKKGVLLLALGHNNYTRMATQLAMSIKLSSPQTHITLAKCEHLEFTPQQDMIKFIDDVIDVPREYYMKGGLDEFIKAKVYLYDITPYEETIFIDSDVLFNPRKDINKLFEELKDVDFTIQNRGAFELGKGELDVKLSWWCNVNDILPAYKLTEGKYYSLSSEFIYFKKCKEVEKLFKTAKEVYAKPLVQTIQFAGGIPDEVVFSISMIINNYYPHKVYYTPIYWEQAERKRLKGEALFSQFYGYSLGGKSLDNVVKTTYDNLVQWFCNQYGIKHYFKAKDKSQWLPERNII